jgi:NAD(P)-dependent dehydrogenase (short-subunit alcohol dehydrogenase family)
MKSYVLTGAGSGIGESIAKTLAQQSDTKLFLIGRNKDKLFNVQSQLKNANQHETISCDISDRNQCMDLLVPRLKLEKSLHGVILNAGVGGENTFGPDDRWDEIIKINLTGSYNVSSACLPTLKDSSEKYRHILYVSSILARLGVPGYSAYCASKAGLLGLMRSQAAQYARDHILVNALAPGWVETEMATLGIRGMAEGQKKSFEEAKREQLSMVPLRKMSTPGEIAALTAFLLSGQQNSMTGQTIDINNGALMV